MLIPLDEAAVREESERASGRRRGRGDRRLLPLLVHEPGRTSCAPREIIHELWPEARVSLSSDVLPRWREYERTSTTVHRRVPEALMRDYMRSLERDCDARRHPARCSSFARTAA